MSSEELLENILSTYNELKNELEFTGFSEPSISFYDDYPEPGHSRLNSVLEEAKEWWVTKQGEDGDYKKHLKPEFENLIKDITIIIENHDSGIETELKDNLGSTHTRWGPIPHRWAAIHSKGRPITIDVQFFINLTSKGLRAGICVSQQKGYSGSWKSFLNRLLKRKELIFEEIKNLENLGYNFINTDTKDYANKFDGTVVIHNDSEEMYNHVSDSDVAEFDIVFYISQENLGKSNLIKDILECFVQTRKLYQSLQPSKFNKKREIV